MVFRRRKQQSPEPEPTNPSVLVEELVRCVADDSGDRAIEIVELLVNNRPQPEDAALLFKAFQSPEITFFGRELLAGPLADAAGTSALPTLINAISANIAEGFDADGIEPHVDGLVESDTEASAAYLRELQNSPDATVREVASDLLAWYYD